MNEVAPIPLSDFTNMHGDAANSMVGAAAVLPASNAADYIQTASKTKILLDQYAQAQYEKHINDMLSMTDKLDTSNVLPQDLSGLNQKYTDFMKDLYNNYKVVGDPSSNIQKYGQLKEDYLNLKNQIETSKQHNTVFTTNQNAMLLHPEFNTDDNRAMMQDFVNTPMADRRTFLLKQPDSFDPEPAVKAAITTATRKVDQTDLSPDGNYLVTKKGEYIDADKAFANYNNNLNYTMYNGKTGMQRMQEMYDRMPVDPQTGVKPPFQDVLKATFTKSLPQDTENVTKVANPVSEEQARLAQEDKDQKRQIAFQREKLVQDTALTREKMEQDNKAINPNYVRPEDAAEAKAMAFTHVMHGLPLSTTFGQNAFGSDPARDMTIPGGYQLKDDGKTPDITKPLPSLKIPQVEFVAAQKNNNGGVTVLVEKNEVQNGKMVKIPIKTHLTQTEFADQLNGIYGPKFMHNVAAGTAAFNKHKLNKTNPSQDDLDKYFGYSVQPGTAAASPVSAPTQVRPWGGTWQK